MLLKKYKDMEYLKMQMCLALFLRAAALDILKKNYTDYAGDKIK